MELLLDTRELEAPEPLELVINNLSKLDEKVYIKMVHRMEPMLLYKLLDERALSYKVDRIDEDFHISIFHKNYKED